MFVKTTIKAALSVLLLLQGHAAFSQQYQGAEAALEQMKSKKPTTKKEVVKTPSDLLREDLKSIPGKYRAMTPDEAARAWLKLVDRYNVMPVDESRGDSRPVTFGEVLRSMPPPVAWKALTTAIEARHTKPGKEPIQDAALVMIGHLLTENEAAQGKDISLLETLATKSTNVNMRSQVAYQVMTLSEELSTRSGDPERIIRNLDLHIAQLQAEPGRGGLEIPDLVTLVGPQKGEAVLRRILLATPVELTVPNTTPTGKLARRLALELVDKLKVPQWSLVNNIDSAKLYEALQKKFDVPSNSKTPAIIKAASGGGGDNSSRKAAQAYYLLSLIVTGRTQEAAVLTAKIRATGADEPFSGEVMKVLAQAGYEEPIARFLFDQLSKNPALPLWDTYIEIATRSHQSDAMIGLIQKSLARPDLPDSLKATLRHSLGQAYLAADRIDEGVAILRQELTAKDAKQDGRSPSRSGAAGSLIEIGRLTKNPSLIEDGLKVLRQESEKALQNQDGSAAITLAEIYIKLGRGPEAEKALIDAIAVSGQQQLPGRYADPRALVALANLYHNAGRSQDVLTLLEQAPNWGAKDLSGILTTSGYNSTDTPVGFMAAQALVSLGRTKEALPILEALLNSMSDYDPAFQLLVDIRGLEAIPFLDALYVRDRFEERPLIWKAVVLFKAGRLDEAEAVAKAAVAIDPSDGEQGKGRRMRVYTVLADIREAKGDANQAAFFRGAVQAIRIAENADDYYSAGLLQRGIKLYEEALTHFADAYCIQSRLAIQLASQGKLAEAEVHLRRAYELMPDSFGRMESHCFGCEGVFRGKNAETMAEKVFKELIAKTPAKPQPHYLLAYLREQQDRYGDALNHLNMAVKLDPDYLNAWKHIEGISEKAFLPAKERDAVALNILRLDPQQKHVTAGFNSVTNLRALWAGLEVAVKFQKPPVPPVLLPLPASRLVIEKEEAVSPARGYFGGDRDAELSEYGGRYGSKRIVSPGQVLADYTILSSLSRLYDMSVGQYGGGY
jgi:tetratricopeptide (TPR) repeat protein